MNRSDLKNYFSKLDTFLTLYLVKKAPVIPDKTKQLIVKYLPYLIIIVVIFSFLPIILALGLGTILTPLLIFSNIFNGLTFSLSLIITGSSLLLNIVSIPGLLSLKKSGWNYLYYSSLLGALNNLITFNLGGFFVGTIISLYLLFQVRSFYK